MPPRGPPEAGVLRSGEPRPPPYEYANAMSITLGTMELLQRSATPPGAVRLAIRGLRVAARTSSFSFKGKDADIQTIAAKLNVATVLEGSVRKMGNKLRITAQLVNVADGYHLWSERYDREMEDVFEIQDEISQAIVKALLAYSEAGASAAAQSILIANIAVALGASAAGCFVALCAHSLKAMIAQRMGAS